MGDEMKNRLKELRKTLKLTQKEFGESIDLSGSNVSNLEKGNVNLTPRNISAICSKYQVDEEWLLHGKGEMFKDLTDEIDVSEHIKKFNLEPEIEEFLQLYLSVDEDTKKYVKGLMKKTISK